MWREAARSRERIPRMVFGHNSNVKVGEMLYHVQTEDRGTSHGENGAAASGARVTARIEGAAEPSQYSTATGRDGKAQLAFDMPRLAGAECALVIEANNGKAHARLHFQLRAKPKVPAAG